MPRSVPPRGVRGEINLLAHLCQLLQAIRDRAASGRPPWTIAQVARLIRRRA
jgi:hypothetical protein